MWSDLVIILAIFDSILKGQKIFTNFLTYFGKFIILKGKYYQITALPDLEKFGHFGDILKDILEASHSQPIYHIYYDIG